MLTATLMGGGLGHGEHVHADMLRPDRIIRTGVIEPYPVAEWDPMTIARKVLEPFAAMGPGGPGVSAEPAPEEIVEQARNYAAAARQGIRPPNWLSRQAMAAIAALLKGVAFTVTAQGRTLLVRPTTDQTQVSAQAAGGLGLVFPEAVRALGDAPALLPIQAAAAGHLGPGPAHYLPLAALPGDRQATDRQPMYLTVR